MAHPLIAKTRNRFFKRKSDVVIFAAVAVIAFLFMFPLLWMTLTAFKTRFDIYKEVPTIFPEQFTSGFSLSANGMPQAPENPVPEAPVIAADNQSLVASWSPSSSAVAYEVWYGLLDDSAQARLWGTETTATRMEIKGLVNGMLYYVWVKAYDQDGRGIFSPMASGTPWLVTVAAPAAPSVNDGKKKLAVSWPTVIGANAYEIWYNRMNDSATAQKYGRDVSGTNAVIALEDTETNPTYFIWIKAKNGSNVSGFSPPSRGTTLPNAVDAPETPSLTGGDGVFTLTWASLKGIDYEMWYSRTNDVATAQRFGSDVAVTDEAMTTAKITGLANGTTYYVWIRGKNQGWTLNNFAYILSQEKFLSCFLNSIVIVTFTVTIVILASIMGGYAFGMRRFKGQQVLFYIVTLVLAIPYIMYLIPIYVMELYVDLRNTWFGLIFPYVALNLPWGLLIMRGAFSTIPIDIRDAATIDGCGEFRFVFQIVTPILKPAVAATTIITFVFAWEELMFAATINRQNYTLPVYFRYLLIETQGQEWGKVGAVISLTIIPVLILFLAFRKFFIKGLSEGMIKG
jgi:ABC-type glycerol-3-phosphate transport system permease component